MPINRWKLGQILREKRTECCENTPEAAAELAATLGDTECLLEKETNAQAVPFILWNDFFNELGIFAPKQKKNQYRYKWGDKVFVDFGCGNIQTELSFPHPAIVLYNFANSVIVVPTTSDDGPDSFSADIEKAVLKVKGDGEIFPKDTVINLHQIKAVHKERIIKNLHCNVKDYSMQREELLRQQRIHGKNAFPEALDLLSCIRLKLAYLFAAPQLQAKDELIRQQEKQLDELRRALRESTAQEAPKGEI